MNNNGGLQNNTKYLAVQPASALTLVGKKESSLGLGCFTAHPGHAVLEQATFHELSLPRADILPPVCIATSLGKHERRNVNTQAEGQYSVFFKLFFIH